MPDSNAQDEIGYDRTNLWHRNHGNLLLSVVVGIVLLGIAFQIYRQSRWEDPEFPDSEHIDQPDDHESALGEGDASIRVIGARSDEGSIIVEIYTSADDMVGVGKSTLLKSVDLQNGEAIVGFSLEEFPRRIAIFAFHDQNNDDALNVNRLGVPTERFGYSGNPKSLADVTFQKVAVNRPEAGATIEVVIR